MAFVSSSQEQIEVVIHFPGLLDHEDSQEQD
jgi:hypothetical protein